MERLQNRTLHRIDEQGNDVAVELKFEPAFFSNHWFVVTDDEYAVTVGVVEEGPLNHKTAYLIGDRVEVTDDGVGYIGPGISRPGLGEIVDIERNDTDHYFGVQMDNGEFSHLKSARITILSTC